MQDKVAGVFLATPRLRAIPERMTDQHVATIQVTGRPATFATAHEKPWKDAVRLAVVESGVEPQVARFAVGLEFRLATARNANEVWDLDNLIKPTLDAVERIFGTRAWRGAPQPADEMTESNASRLSSAPQGRARSRGPLSMFGLLSRTNESRKCLAL